MKWEKVKLKDCCLSIADGDHQAPPKADTGIPFVTISNIVENCFDFSNTMFVPESYYKALDDKRRVQEGDILYSVVGSFGIPVLIKDNTKFVFQRHIAILRPNANKIDSRFLYYSMLSRDFYAKADSVAVGAAQRTISLNALRNLEINIPALSFQRRISSILSAYDDLIENNKKQIKLLEEAAQRLYKEWFVDLRFPGHENVPVVDGVPEGWERKKISELCDTVGGGTPSTKVKEFYENGNIPWVTPTDITKNFGLILLDTEKKITKEGLQNSSAKMIPANSVLMTSRASIGYFGICEFPVCTNQGFISCIPNDKRFTFLLLYNLLSRIDEIRSKASGSTFLEIGKKTFREFEILTPSSDILEKFDRILSYYIEKMKKCKKIISGLEQARDRLLPKLMNGEIEV